MLRNRKDISRPDGVRHASHDLGHRDILRSGHYDQACGRRMTWMVPFLASLIGFLSVFVMIALHARYPKMTFIEYCPRILGRWPGQALGLVYLVSLLYSFGIVLREYGEFIVSQFLVETPQFVVIVCLVAVAPTLSTWGSKYWREALKSSCHSP